MFLIRILSSFVVSLYSQTKIVSNIVLDDVINEMLLKYEESKRLHSVTNLFSGAKFIEIG